MRIVILGKGHLLWQNRIVISGTWANRLDRMQKQNIRKRSKPREFDPSKYAHEDLFDPVKWAWAFRNWSD